MTTRTQNLLSVGALAAALVITLLPESTTPSATHTASAPIQVSQLAR